MTVFIAGPRKITSLDDNVKSRLASIINKNLNVILGDANGVDHLVQAFLYDKRYLNVTVYASNGVTRNNIGHWNVRNIPVDKNTKGFAFYAAKDKRMADDADYGFMIWNGESKGTLANIINLCGQEKKTVIYLTKTKELFCVDNISAVKELISNLGDGVNLLFAELTQTIKQPKNRQTTLPLTGTAFNKS